VRLPQIMQKNP